MLLRLTLWGSKTHAPPVSDDFARVAGRSGRRQLNMFNTKLYALNVQARRVCRAPAVWAIITTNRGTPPASGLDDFGAQGGRSRRTRWATRVSPRPRATSARTYSKLTVQ